MLELNNPRWAELEQAYGSAAEAVLELSTEVSEEFIEWLHER